MATTVPSVLVQTSTPPPVSLLTPSTIGQHAPNAAPITINVVTGTAIPSASTGKQKPQIPPTSEGFKFSLETPSLSSGTLDKYLKAVLGTESSNAIPDLLKPTDSQTGQVQAPTQPTPSTAPATTTPTPSTPASAAAPSIAPHPIDSVKSATEAKEPQQPVAQSQPLETHKATAAAAAEPSTPPSDASNTQLATTTGESGEVIPIPRGQSYVDITEYLNMPQSEAAKKLGIPPSTLSKRWKEAVRKRKWPYRMICKIDKEIMTLLHNVPQGPNAPPLPEEIESALGHLLRKRQEELRPVVIRI